METLPLAPVATRQVHVDGILCDSCKNWFHFECETLTVDDVGRYDCSDPYYCLSCTHDGKPDDISDLIMLERNPQENDPHLSADHSQENPLSSQTHPKQIAYQHATDSMSVQTDPEQAGIPGKVYSPMGPNTLGISPPSKQNLSTVKTYHDHLSIVQPPLSDCLNEDKGTAQGSISPDLATVIPIVNSL